MASMRKRETLQIPLLRHISRRNPLYAAYRSANMAAITSLRPQPTSAAKAHRRLDWQPPDISRANSVAGGGGVAFVGVSAWALTQFDAPSKIQTPDRARARTCPAEQKELIISNWQLYIDSRTRRPQPTTIDDFEEQTGITSPTPTTSPTTTSSSPRSSNQLGSCQTVKRDMFMLTDWMAGEDDPARLDPEARPREHAQRRREPAAEPARTPRWTPAASTPCRGRAA